MRPELTEAAVHRILPLTSSEVYISVDALRPGASRDERHWHNATKAVASDLEKQYARVFSFQWKAWLGIRDHFMRAFHELFEIHPSVIMLEEDVLISGNGLTFLSEHANAGSPLTTAYTSSVHNHCPHNSLKSAFPEQWGIAVNQELYGEANKVLASSSMRLATIQQILRTQIGGKASVDYASRFWIRHFSKAVRSQHGWDSLLQYTSWIMGTLATVPASSHVQDISHLDKRAFTSRSGRRTNGNHPFKGQLTTYGISCLSCETLSTKRVRPTLLDRVRQVNRRLRSG